MYDYYSQIYLYIYPLIYIFIFQYFLIAMQNKNLIIISPTDTSTPKSIIYPDKRLRQLIDNSAHG